MAEAQTLWMPPGRKCKSYGTDMPASMSNNSFAWEGPTGIIACLWSLLVPCSLLGGPTGLDRLLTAARPTAQHKDRSSSQRSGVGGRLY
eukprot:scaffold284078_cov19-Tisochrysis_lutea.AAC.4